MSRTARKALRRAGWERMLEGLWLVGEGRGGLTVSSTATAVEVGGIVVLILMLDFWSSVKKVWWCFVQALQVLLQVLFAVVNVLIVRMLFLLYC